MKSAASEAEQHATASSRITGGVVIVIGLICLVDIVVEWRTRGGLIAGAVIAAAMVVAYVGLVRPSVTMSPERLTIRNHVRDHHVPWSQVESAEMVDILRVKTADRTLRAPGVQLVMRDMRRERAGRIRTGDMSSVSRAELVVGRVDHHRDHYAKTSTGEITTHWAVPELVATGVLLLIAGITWLVS